MLVLLVLVLYLDRRRRVPNGKIGAVLLLDANQIIVRCTNLAQVINLQQPKISLKGFSIKYLSNFVTADEQQVAQNIIDWVGLLSRGTCNSAHFEYVPHSPNRTAFTLNCFIERLPKGFIMCHLLRPQLQDWVFKKNFVLHALHMGAKTVPIGISVKHYGDSSDGRYVFINRWMRQLFQNIDLERSVWTEQKDRDEDLALGHLGISGEMREFVLKNGRTVNLEVCKRRFFDDNRQLYVCTSVVDVSQSMARLESAEQKYFDLEMAAKAGYMSAWSYDVKQQMSHTIYGNTLSHNGLKFYDLMQQIHEDDRVKFRNAVNALLSSQKERLSLRFRYRDALVGQNRWMESKMIACKSPQGQVTHINGMQRDITAEVLQQRQDEVLRDCLNHSLRMSGITVWAYRLVSRQLVLFVGREVPVDNITPEALNNHQPLISNEYSVYLRQLLGGDIDQFVYSKPETDGCTYEYQVYMHREDGIPDLVVGERRLLKNVEVRV